ncbi:MAG: EscU/YscU/HrcU family type III secretion system export apparatus switch protein [Spirochaetes bacterium]|nr:EscU/YscU/HrcU family type III secretion system export apparatus switch protein [Spirochaetota bacterium]
MTGPDKAVALKINDFSGIPEVIARAKGILVEKMIKIAENSNIEIYEDKDLAETLFTLNTNADIPPELYKPVIEVLVYCYNINSELKKKLDLKFLGKRD